MSPARVVYDRFHVERLAADAVDAVRRAEQHRLGATAAKAIKGTVAADELRPGKPILELPHKGVRIVAQKDRAHSRPGGGHEHRPERARAHRETH